MRKMSVRVRLSRRLRQVWHAVPRTFDKGKTSGTRAAKGMHRSIEGMFSKGIAGRAYKK